MNIGQASVRSGVTAKMIRYYESIGLLPSPERKASNYRNYDASDVQRLCFVRRARDLGFSVDRIRDLMTLWSDRNRCSSQVKSLALDHIAEIQSKIALMRDMADQLQAMADACEGDDQPDCAIIDGLEGGISTSVDAPAAVSMERA